MKKLLTILVILTLLSGSALAKISGIPIEDDQYAHMFGGAYMTEIGKDAGLEWWQTSLMVLGVSYAKEMSDTNGTGFSSTDISFGMAGVAMSYGFESLMNITGLNSGSVAKKESVKKEEIKSTRYSLEEVENRIVNIVEKMRRSDDEQIKQLAQYGEEFMVDYYKYDGHIRFFRETYRRKDNGLYFAHNNTFIIRPDMSEEALDRTIVSLITNYQQNMTDAKAFDVFVKNAGKDNVTEEYLSYQEQAKEISDKYIALYESADAPKVAMK